MIKNLDEAQDILYGMMHEENYSNGATNVFTFYYYELEEGNKFHTVMHLKQELKKDLTVTATKHANGYATDEELEDLKTMFNLLFS